MIAHKLDIALHEAIQMHASHYSNGALDLEKILSAIGEVAASYLAEMPKPCDRQSLFNQLCIGIAGATNGKTGTNSIWVLLKQ